MHVHTNHGSSRGSAVVSPQTSNALSWETKAMCIFDCIIDGMDRDNGGTLVLVLAKTVWGSVNETFGGCSDGSTKMEEDCDG